MWGPIINLVQLFFGYRQIDLFEEPGATGTSAVRADEGDEASAVVAADDPDAPTGDGA